MRSPDWTIAIRADASDEIGSGHVVRCLSLAEGLVARGARVRFVCRELPGHMIGQIEKEGHAAIALPARPTLDEARDAEATLAALGPGPVDWLIVDHYQLGARWESVLRPHARRIMAIDDLAERAHAGARRCSSPSAIRKSGSPTSSPRL
jgi:UDP-2,4-diacetamido-2,4,6-trideoxy-beta-L-altropyranose hydrolase